MNHTDQTQEKSREYLAEICLLGALMHDPISFSRIENIISESDFTNAANAEWFCQIKKMLDEERPVDVFLIAEDLHKIRPSMNWAGHIAEAMFSAPSAANLVHYAGVVAGNARERKLRKTGVAISDLMSQAHLSHNDRMMMAEDHLLSFSDAGTTRARHTFSISEALSQSVEGVEKRFGSNSEEELIEFPFGFDSLDDMTMGSHRGDLIIVAGRPSMGKTAFSMNVAESFCKNGKAVLVMSAEMSAQQLANRMITSVGRIDAQRFRKGNLIDDDWTRLTYALNRLSAYKMQIDENAVITPASIRKAAKKSIRDMGGLDAIVVDYLQLMTTNGKSQGNRGNDISEISRELKQIAKEFGVPVIALSQLNRSLEQRPNKRPIMSDLRESGAIEQDADLILFLYRDEVYNPDSKEKGVAEIIIGKQRNGPTGTVCCAFIGSYSRFENLSTRNDY